MAITGELSESWDVVSTSDTYIADYVEAAMPTSTSSVNIKSTPQEKVANGVLGGDVFSSRKSSLPAETEVRGIDVKMEKWNEVIMEDRIEELERKRWISERGRDGAVRVDE